MRHIFPFIIGLLSLSAFADSSVCPNQFPMDPFNHPTVIPDGPFKGECLDTSKYRSADSLTPQQRADFGVDTYLRANHLAPSDVIVGANFYHDGKFWIIVVPKQDISDVVYNATSLTGDMKLAPDIYHSQLRIRMNTSGPAVQLISQNPENFPGHTTQAYNQDLVVSLFATRSKEEADTTFDPVKGLTGHYTASVVLEDFHTGTDWAKTDPFTMRQFKTTLTQQQSQELLSKAIDIGSQRGIGEMYDTLDNSCSDLVFELLKAATNYQEDDWGWFDFMRKFVEPKAESVIPLHVMRNDGFIGDSELPTLSQEEAAASVE